MAGIDDFMLDYAGSPVSLDAIRLIARLAHQGQTYGSGELDYFASHVEPVAERVKADPKGTSLHVALAYLHDVLEDTPITRAELETLVGDDLATRVSLLTRNSGEVYSAYIDRVAGEPVSRLVKIHDLQQNLSCHPPKSLAKRYRQALAKLGVTEVPA